MGRFVQPINKGQFLGSSGRLELIGKKTKMKFTHGIARPSHDRAPGQDKVGYPVSVVRMSNLLFENAEIECNGNRK